MIDINQYKLAAYSMIDAYYQHETMNDAVDDVIEDHCLPYNVLCAMWVAINATEVPE